MKNNKRPCSDEGLSLSVFPAMFTPVENALVTFVNAFSFKRILESGNFMCKFDALYLDGFLLVILAKAFGVRVRRVSFDMTSCAPTVFSKAQAEGNTVYLVGSDSESIECAYRNILEKFPKLKICGYRNGYFADAQEQEAFAKKIVETCPEIVIVGMGAVRQEELLLELRRAGWRGAGYTCGGFFHQAAKKVDYYPRIIDSLHLRWAYRILNEPKLLKRYLVDYPIGAVVFCKFILSLKKSQ